MKYLNNVLTTSAKWHRKHFISTIATYIFSPRAQGTVRNTEYIPDTSLKWLKQIFHQWRWTADITAYKTTSVSLTIREMQSKCDTTTHLLECLKKKKNPGTIKCRQRRRATGAFIDGNAKWHCHLGKVLQVYYTDKCTFRFHFKLSTQEEWNWCAQRSSYVIACSSSTHNCQNLETTQMAFNQWGNTQAVVQPYSAILLNKKKESTLASCNSMNDS